MITCPVCGVEIKKKTDDVAYYRGRGSKFTKSDPFSDNPLLFCSRECRTDYYAEINEQHKEPAYGDRLSMGFALLGD